MSLSKKLQQLLKRDASLLVEDIVNTTTEQSQIMALKQIVPKLTPVQWNKIFFDDLRTFSNDDFNLLNQLASGLYQRYQTYLKNPKQYNSSITQ